MNFRSTYKSIAFASLLGTFTAACSQETANDVNQGINEAQTEVTNESVEANRDIEEFEAWVQDRSGRAETATKEEWAETRAEYRRREAELEAESADWDQETRQAWDELKADWNETENTVRERLGEIDDVEVDVDVERQNN
ncbi:hypothetical protein [Pontibacter pamirensis]|uniref:hypothetical protein n=1 Tax=Pontibacter pamirensis TaxID=2562824 RepID=UPI001389687D|nr:hypothetical protein [Pontibacter pamirensis]